MNIELIGSWTDAIESCEICEGSLEAAVAKYDAAVQHGILSSNMALKVAMEKLIQAHDSFILTMTTQLKVVLEANAGNAPAAEAALTGPVGADMSEEHNTITPEETGEGKVALEANAGNAPAAEAALAGPVGADMSEEDNTITPEETGEGA